MEVGGFEQAHEEVLQTIEQQAKSRAVRASSIIKKHSNKILSNAAGRSGSTVKKNGVKRTYRASAPGEPPALRSGDLRRSWNPLPKSDMYASGGKVYTAGIRTNIIYAPMLQNGTSKMAARPFEDPIKEAAWPEVKAIFSEPYLT